MKLIRAIALFALIVPALAALPACKEKSPDGPTGATNLPSDPNGANVEPGAGHGGPVIQLGASTVGPFEVSATRDAGAIVAGQDAPIDVTVTPVSGSGAKAAAVRFWIGAKDARGSVKARAEVENSAEPHRWHTHAEIPRVLPDDSRIWVEIEDESGELWVTSFDLMR